MPTKTWSQSPHTRFPNNKCGIRTFYWNKQDLLIPLPTNSRSPQSAIQGHKKIQDS